jgi:hypothetical protein
MQSDVLALTHDQILEDGIYICQGKTETRQIKAWSGRTCAAAALGRLSTHFKVIASGLT